MHIITLFVKNFRFSLTNQALLTQLSEDFAFYKLQINETFSRCKK